MGHCQSKSKCKDKSDNIIQIERKSDNIIQVKDKYLFTDSDTSIYFLKITFVNTDDTAIIKSCEGPLKRLLGWEHNEFVNKSYTDFIHPDDNTDYISYIRKTKSLFHEKLVSVRYKHKNGEWVKSLWEVYFNEKTQLWKCFVFVIDKYDHDLSRKQLKFNVEHESAKIFMKKISHELRNHLHVCLGNLQLLEMCPTCETKNNTEIKTSSEYINISSNILDSILNWTKYTGSEHVKHEEKSEMIIADYISNLIHGFGNMALSKNIVIEFDNRCGG